MSASMTVNPTSTPGLWNVRMQYDMSDGQRIDMAINVSTPHPSPRVTDLERLCIQQAQLLLGNMLQALPDFQDM